MSWILARSLTCNTLFSDSCVDSPVLCSLNVLSCFLTPSCRLVGLAPAAAKCFCTTNCIRSTSRELLSQWRPQFEDAGCELRRPHNYDRKHKDVHQKVLLSTKILRMKGIPGKLQKKFVETFGITEVIGQQAHRLSLLEDWKIHPVFQMSLLKN